MKRDIILLSLFFSLFLFAGCFDDEGSYDYDKLDAPIWLFDTESENIEVNAYEGQVAKFKASNLFRWAGDSAARAQEVRYEWRIRGILVGEECDFEIETDSLMKKINMTKFEDKMIFGSFSIIDKKTGINFMVQAGFTFNPRYNDGDWLVLSEDNGRTKCSFLKRKRRTENREVYFELTEDVYKKVNGSDIPGKPLSMAKGLAKNIGPLGAMTIITDQVAYVLDNSSLKKVTELKDEFLDGTPTNFKPVAQRDCDNLTEGGYSFVATEDGRIFRRKTTENYLGGKFLTDPYVLDAKGYKITKFGLSGFGLRNVPCYDEKNRRMLVINFHAVEVEDEVYVRTHKFIPITPLKNADLSNVAPVWEMPEGTEMLFMTYTDNLWVEDVSWYGQEAYTAVYKGADGKVYMADFVIDAATAECVENLDAKVQEFPDPEVTTESVFLTSIFDYSAKYALVYTVGNQVRWVYRPYYDDEAYLLFEVDTDSKITYIGYMTSYDQYGKMVVGCENGDIMLYENIWDAPRQVCKFNLGGKIVTAKELGNPYERCEIY